MNHANTRELYEYWNGLRGGQPAPQRGEVDPTFLRRILADTFILELAPDGAWRYRLAGTRICNAYCREMRARDFLADFTADDRERLSPMMDTLALRASPVIMTLDASSGRGQRVRFECLLLPLRNVGPRFERIVGVLAAIEKPFWLGTTPVVRQEVAGLRQFVERRTESLGPLRATTLSLPPRTGDRRRPTLVVLAGGKS
jgi:hypothetical protein